jgi:hypothetical protein
MDVVRGFLADPGERRSPEGEGAATPTEIIVRHLRAEGYATA